jgi:CheY-like chemotaxis protein
MDSELETQFGSTSKSSSKLYHLVVTNSTVILSQLRWGAFRRLNLRTDVADSARAVLQLLGKGRPDAVVLESKLVGGDAFDLCKRVKTELGMGDLPVVIVSEGSISRPMLSKIQDSGCDEVLNAPLSRGQLYTVLADHLNLPRRRNYRVRVQAPVTARGTYLEVKGEIYDLAVSGARIRLDEPLSSESRLTVYIDPPGGGEIQLPGKVVWHRPYSRGAELALQFDPVPEEVANQLEILATWRLENRGDHQVVVLQRSLNERSNFTGLAEQLAGKVIFDMRHLTLIASIGVGKWVSFLRSIPEEVQYRFVHCSVGFCVQASYLTDMLGRGEITTFFAPYFCAQCTCEVERELDAGNLDPDTLDIPVMHCAVCGQKLEFEDLPERYLKFLKP